jgi:two-component system nitrate/nitrite response regulator NarL
MMGNDMRDIRILIVDEHLLMRDSLATIIGQNEGMRVVGEAGDGIGAIEAARQSQPDVILLDIEMPGMDGLETILRIRSEIPQACVILLADRDEERLVVEAVQLGAIGYLSKTCGANELVEVIRKVYRGELIPPSSAVPPVLEAPRPPGGPTGRLHADELTKQELKTPGLAAQDMTDASQDLNACDMGILKLVAQGASSRTIALKMSCSERTVTRRLSRLCRHLGVRNRYQAVAIAAASGWLQEE